MGGQASIAAERCRTGGQPRHAVDEPAARIRGDQADFGIEGQAPAPEFSGRLEPGEHAVGREPTERAVRLGPQQGVSFLGPPDAHADVRIRRPPGEQGAHFRGFLPRQTGSVIRRDLVHRGKHRGFEPVLNLVSLPV